MTSVGQRLERHEYPCHSHQLFCIFRTKLRSCGSSDPPLAVMRAEGVANSTGFLFTSKAARSVACEAGQRFRSPDCLSRARQHHLIPRLDQAYEPAGVSVLLIPGRRIPAGRSDVDRFRSGLRPGWIIGRRTGSGPKWASDGRTWKGRGVRFTRGSVCRTRQKADTGSRRRQHVIPVILVGRTADLCSFSARRGPLTRRGLSVTIRDLHRVRPFGTVRSAGSCRGAAAREGPGRGRGAAFP